MKQLSLIRSQVSTATHRNQSYFYTNSVQLKTEIKKIIPLQELQKIFGVNLTKHMQKLYAENCKTPMQAIKEILNNGHTMFMDWKIQDSKDVLKLIFSSAPVPMKILAGCIYTYRQVDCKFYMEAKELDLLKQF